MVVSGRPRTTAKSDFMDATLSRGHHEDLEAKYRSDSSEGVSVFWR